VIHATDVAYAHDDAQASFVFVSSVQTSDAHSRATARAHTHPCAVFGLSDENRAGRNEEEYQVMQFYIFMKDRRGFIVRIPSPHHETEPLPRHLRVAVAAVHVCARVCAFVSVRVRACACVCVRVRQHGVGGIAYPMCQSEAVQSPK